MDARTGDLQTDPRWPELLAFCAHELRTPITPGVGFLNWLLKENFGPLSERQRDALEHVQRSFVEIVRVVNELSELSQLESGKATFNRGTVNLASVLSDSIAGLPELPGRAITVSLIADGALSVHGDPLRLRDAFSAILFALRREMVTSDALVVRAEARDQDNVAIVRIVIGAPARIEELCHLAPSALAAFHEWRGGNGLRLAKARRIIEAHGGRVWGLPAPDTTEEEKIETMRRDTKATAIVVIPAAR